MSNKELANKCFTAFFALLIIIILIAVGIDYFMPRRLLGHWAMNQTEYVILKEIDQGEIPDEAPVMGEMGILKVPAHVNVKLEADIFFWLDEIRYRGVGGIYRLNGEYFVITWKKGDDWRMSVRTFLKRDGENLRTGWPNKKPPTENIQWSPSKLWPTK